MLESVPKFDTAQIPSNLGAGSDESEIYIGDFSTIILGVRENIVFTIHRDGAVGSDNATSEMKVFLRMYLRADTAITQPTHLTRIIGATTV